MKNFFFALSIFAFASIALATSARAEKFSALDSARAKYKSARTMTAEFTQKQKNLALGTTKESSGRIFVKRSSSGGAIQYRWQTDKPDASLLVSNGKKVWYYTPPFRKDERGQVMIRSADSGQSRLALDLLTGGGDGKSYKTRQLAEEGRFELKPLKPVGDVSRVELFLEKPTNLVYKVVLKTKTGNETELKLSNVTLGPKLPDSMFQFTPPPDTEEIQ